MDAASCRRRPAGAEDTAVLDVQFPYGLTGVLSDSIPAGSTRPLYVSLEGFRVPRSREAEVSVRLPEGLTAIPGKGWSVSEDGREAAAQWRLPPDYGDVFSLLSLRADGPVSEEEQSVEVSVSGDGIELTRSVPFRITEGEAEKAGAGTAAPVSNPGLTGMCRRLRYRWMIRAAEMTGSRTGF